MLAKNNEFSMCEIIEYSCPEWQDYENEDYEKWWVFRVYAADWKELEDNLLLQREYAVEWMTAQVFRKQIRSYGQI